MRRYISTSSITQKGVLEYELGHIQATFFRQIRSIYKNPRTMQTPQCVHPTKNVPPAGRSFFQKLDQRLSHAFGVVPPGVFGIAQVGGDQAKAVDMLVWQSYPF